jgi:transcriptional regulator with XRE-family HTH domain
MARTARVRSARDLGAVVAEARQLRGWTQMDLAENTGLERSYLARIETGASVILLDRVFRLLRRLGVEVTVTFPEPRADAAADAQDGQ